MELMEESLHSKIRRNSALESFVDRLQWALDAARSLEFLHGREPVIVHGDVKSMNFLACCVDGPGDVRIKLSDFGLSLPRGNTSLQLELDNMAHSDRGFHGGTIPWTAPEVL